MSEAYSRKDLVEVLAKTHEMSKAATGILVLDIFRQIAKALKKGKRVTLAPFGSFEIKQRAARKGRNPATGAAIKINAKNIVKFNAYAGLKDETG